MPKYWDIIDNGMKEGKRLHLSRKNKRILGLCGGIAEYFGWDPALVRWLFFALVVLSFLWYPIFPLAFLLIYFTSPLFFPYE